MKITICGSINFINEMAGLSEKLTALGHEVKMPPQKFTDESGKEWDATDYYAYKYDDKGNLAYTARQYRAMRSWGEAVYNDTFRVGSYDTKIHLRRTNKMWMFIDRNYSVNNPFTAASYNSYGLPLMFDGRQYLQGLITLVPFISGNTAVTYNCN